MQTPLWLRSDRYSVRCLFKGIGPHHSPSLRSSRPTTRRARAESRRVLGFRGVIPGGGHPVFGRYAGEARGSQGRTLPCAAWGFAAQRHPPGWQAVDPDTRCVPRSDHRSVPTSEPRSLRWLRSRSVPREPCGQTRGQGPRRAHRSGSMVIAHPARSTRERTGVSDPRPLSDRQSRRRCPS